MRATAQKSVKNPSKNAKNGHFAIFQRENSPFSANFQISSLKSAVFWHLRRRTCAARRARQAKASVQRAASKKLPDGNDNQQISPRAQPAGTMSKR
ncbi:MAG: hypothetical protein EOM20_06720 [Spartobacteria bacterium]|nr:hypothetical protein [Spartobacteria bacterium]